MKRNLMPGDEKVKLVLPSAGPFAEAAQGPKTARNLPKKQLLAISALGRDAFKRGRPYSECPHNGPLNQKRWAWLSGWFSAEDDSKRDEEPKATPEARSAEGTQ